VYQPDTQRTLLAKDGTNGIWPAISQFSKRSWFFYMPRSRDMGQIILLPLRRKACSEFFQPEKSDGFGREGTRDLRLQRPACYPLDHRSRSRWGWWSTPGSGRFLARERPGTRCIGGGAQARSGRVRKISPSGLAQACEWIGLIAHTAPISASILLRSHNPQTPIL
jgi:hypothetical protein